MLGMSNRMLTDLSTRVHLPAVHSNAQLSKMIFAYPYSVLLDNPYPSGPWITLKDLFLSWVSILIVCTQRSTVI